MSGSPIYRMILFPCEAHYAPESWAILAGALQETEIIGSSFGEHQDYRFLVGDKFLQYVTFLGCSPHIELQPPADGSLNFCHFQFSQFKQNPIFRHASNNVFARCPQCGKRIATWQHPVSQWRENPQCFMFACEKCHAEISLYQLSWRHTAAVARVFIDIFSIYPQEAIPTDQFMRVMQNATGEKWDYFYADQ